MSGFMLISLVTVTLTPTTHSVDNNQTVLSRYGQQCLNHTDCGDGTFLACYYGYCECSYRVPYYIGGEKCKNLKPTYCSSCAEYNAACNTDTDCRGDLVCDRVSSGACRCPIWQPYYSGAGKCSEEESYCLDGSKRCSVSLYSSCPDLQPCRNGCCSKSTTTTENPSPKPGFAGFNPNCRNDTDCPNSYVCDDGTCQCPIALPNAAFNETSFAYKCQANPPSAIRGRPCFMCAEFGTRCEGTGLGAFVCRLGLSCIDGVCKCNQFLNSAANQRYLGLGLCSSASQNDMESLFQPRPVKTLHYGKVCEDTKDCGDQNLVCKSGYCECPSNMPYHIGPGDRCQAAKPTDALCQGCGELGASCDLLVTCRHQLLCGADSRCQCATNEIYIGNGRCTTRPTTSSTTTTTTKTPREFQLLVNENVRPSDWTGSYGQPCGFAGSCLGRLVCLDNNICGCPANKPNYVAASKTCQPNVVEAEPSSASPQQQNIVVSSGTEVPNWNFPLLTTAFLLIACLR